MAIGRKIDDKMQGLQPGAAGSTTSPTAGPAAPASPASPASRRDGVLGRLKKKYPEKSFDDDESIYGQIDDDYASYDKELGELKDREHKIGDMFRADPRSAVIWNEWSKGGNPTTELVRLFGRDIVSALDDPERQEELAEANKEYLDRVAKNKELEDQYQENLQKSLENLSQMQEEEGLSDDDIDSAMELLSQIVSDGIVGKFTRESVELALKARDYDGDVAAANHAGEVRGRNARINEKLRRGRRGDGTTALDGANSRESGLLRPDPDLGALGTLGTSGDIWSRGGEKRTKNA